MDDLVGWFAVDHRFSGKLPSAVRTPKLPVRVVFDNPVLVALNEVTRPFFVVLVQELAAVCTVNLYGMSFSHVSYQYVVRMLYSTGVSASSPVFCDPVKHIRSRSRPVGLRYDRGGTRSGTGVNGCFIR